MIKMDVLNVLLLRPGRPPGLLPEERQGHPMKAASRDQLQARSIRNDGPQFIYHPSFEQPDAERVYGGVQTTSDTSVGFMPDETTRDYARRMHYAAWRVSTARSRREAAGWRQRYYDCRDSIVVGNQKLTFRAVRKWSPPPQLAEDMASECQIVLIRVVAAYNPWLGIRFSTYAFTCLMRALSRQSQRQ
jgi:hypothetical protein